MTNFNGLSEKKDNGTEQEKEEIKREVKEYLDLVIEKAFKSKILDEKFRGKYNGGHLYLVFDQDGFRVNTSYRPSSEQFHYDSDKHPTLLIPEAETLGTIHDHNELLNDLSRLYVDQNKKGILSQIGDYYLALEKMPQKGNEEVFESVERALVFRDKEDAEREYDVICNPKKYMPYNHQ